MKIYCNSCNKHLDGSKEKFTFSIGLDPMNGILEDTSYILLRPYSYGPDKYCGRCYNLLISRVRPANAGVDLAEGYGFHG